MDSTRRSAKAGEHSAPTGASSKSGSPYQRIVVDECRRHAFGHDVTVGHAVPAHVGDREPIQQIEKLAGGRAETRGDPVPREIHQRLGQDLWPVAGEVGRGHDAAAAKDFPLDHPGDRALVEARRALVGNQTQRRREFAEIEHGGAAELAVDPGKRAAGTQVLAKRTEARQEFVVLADEQELRPVHAQALFGQRDGGLHDGAPGQFSPAEMGLPQARDGTRNAHREMPLLGLEAHRPGRLVVLDRPTLVDLEHVRRHGFRRPQIGVDRDHRATRRVIAAHAGVAADAALRGFDHEAGESRRDDGVPGVAAGLADAPAPAGPAAALWPALTTQCPPAARPAGAISRVTVIVRP